MIRWGMVIDVDKCTGCQACIVACRAENNVPFAGPKDAAMGRSIFWVEMLALTEGEYPDVETKFIPVPCMHCDNTPCIKYCPVGATFRSDEGIVAQVYARCIGCRYCTTACPYTRRYFNWGKPSWPKGMETYLNPDVSVRPKGVVEKCNFCIQRIRRAKEKAREENRPLRDGDVVPACVETCPAGAMYFGNLNDPESTVSKLTQSRRAFRLQEDLGTQPKVYYLTEGEWFDTKRQS